VTATFSLEFTRRFEAAHRFFGGDSIRCQSLHGHSWEVTVVIESNLDPAIANPLARKERMLAEFGATKQAWHEFVDTTLDHSVMLNEADPLIHYLRKKEPGHRIVATPGNPTTELLAALFKSKVNVFLRHTSNELLCGRVRLRETPTNTVELAHYGRYLDGLPTSSKHWWNQPNNSGSDIDDE